MAHKELMHSLIHADHTVNHWMNTGGTWWLLGPASVCWVLIALWIGRQDLNDPRWKLAT